MMWSNERFCGTRDKASVSEILEVDTYICIEKSLSGSTTVARTQTRGRAGGGQTGPGGAGDGQSGLVSRVRWFFRLQAR